MKEVQLINIRGGRILDETTDVQGRLADIHIAGGVITEIVEAGSKLPKADIDLDATNCFVSPGFVDLHVHLREPGREESNY